MNREMAPCGTRANYRRGCRCERCVEANRKHSALSTRKEEECAGVETVRARSRLKNAKYPGRHGDPMRRKASLAVTDLVRRGVIQRPEVCEQCGVQPGVDYVGKPLIWAHLTNPPELDREWLCSTCVGVRRRKYS